MWNLKPSSSNKWCQVLPNSLIPLFTKLQFIQSYLCSIKNCIIKPCSYRTCLTDIYIRQYLMYLGFTACRNYIIFVSVLSCLCIIELPHYPLALWTILEDFSKLAKLFLYVFTLFISKKIAFTKVIQTHNFIY